MGELVDLLPIVLIALVLWLAGLSLTFYKLLNHYKKIARKASGGDLIKAIEELIKAEGKNTVEIKHLKDELGRVNKQSVFPIQKVGLTRYNPFNETGGDQSFSLCLLDGLDTGFVLTALHTRDRTRVYTKSISGGESKYELSREEERALSEARKSK
ncbi:hypothetical protein A2803_02345 [Candidatus Woesebacteria bacterium RIFCSPHIGHO2_01_FULL_44_21]|uniref:DUF4446 domain-containing protein n=1 Tax=Candidatus Woesebacteria bacterium RIFCSPHIGHO2_01_FULL_44_21 TaxID=1802503 RepID=A0A1F7YW40_9BACT|nr:MAG: hypothetical protein A2803_02345 [Candidatus Woesebacteria bacterium RIFCSPHIGHO2_01_FULL_44_21]OGM70440.1 MAG: hypothetical protein A2897_01610 [Candidatus Woesebacteria bacterium RIFCSPLOWO2_01_FULL_44_24b]